VGGFAAAAALNLLSLAGLADSVVEWGCFLQIDGIIANYQLLKTLMFGLLPFSVSDWLKDYLIITASFSIMLNIYARLAERKPIGQILADDGANGIIFEAALFMVPWVVLVWLALRQILWRAQFERVRHILSADDTYRKQLEVAKNREDEKARLLTCTVIAYPLACLALLFVFSDFAYTLTGRSEIAGVSFREECNAGGEIIRFGPP